jgi:hypothetical protein
MRPLVPKIKGTARPVPTFADALSVERFDTYLKWAAGDPDLAGRLYTYNVQLSAALYGPLHMHEVALRNKVDARLVQVHGTGWIHDPVVLRTAYQQACVRQALQTLKQAGKAASRPQIVAELSFGFWSSLFGRESHHLWQALRPIFQAKGIQRATIAHDLRETRLFRNRVAHYEPILAIPLAHRYDDITTLTGWLSPSAAAWIARYSTWPGLYPAVPILVPEPRSGGLVVAQAVLPFLPQ